MRIALLAKPDSEIAATIAREVHGWLTERGHTVLVEASTAADAGLPAGFAREAFDGQADIAIALGGDGTQLLAARVFGPTAVPIFGVNSGRLGFLTDTDPDHLYEVLAGVLAGDYAVEERMMLTADVERDGELVGSASAFNDIVVNKGALAQVARLETWVNDSFVSNYLADGIIFATPTGSTAYGLAVGGPIIEPSTDVILVAPICPHLLTNRPLVLSGSSLVECRIMESRGDLYLTIDGQEGFPLHVGDVIRVRRAAHRAHLVRAASRDFFEILRRKMGWGIS